MLGEGTDVHLLRVSLILPTPDLGSGISCVHRCGEGGQHPCPGFLWVERKGLEEENLGWGGSVETLGSFWSQEGNEEDSGQSWQRPGTRDLRSQKVGGDKHSNGLHVRF